MKLMLCFGMNELLHKQTNDELNRSKLCASRHLLNHIWQSCTLPWLVPHERHRDEHDEEMVVEKKGGRLKIKFLLRCRKIHGVCVCVHDAGFLKIYAKLFDTSQPSAAPYWNMINFPLPLRLTNQRCCWCFRVFFLVYTNCAYTQRTFAHTENPVVIVAGVCRQWAASICHTYKALIRHLCVWKYHLTATNEQHYEPK